MSRQQGTFQFPSNFEVQIVGPLDARMTVPTKADLYSTQMQASYPYAGMICTVTNDPVSGYNGLYVLNQMPCIQANWTKAGADASEYNYATFSGNTLKLYHPDGSYDPVDLSTLVPNNQVVGMSLAGTQLILTRQNLPTIVCDLNALMISGAQLKKGITTHDFATYTEADFFLTTFTDHYQGGLLENIFYKEVTFANFTAKETTIILKISSTQPNHYVLRLPTLDDPDVANNIGKRIRLFMKKNNISDTNKTFMVSTNWQNSGLTGRLMSIKSATQVAGVGYFLPMESYEVVDLFWDGEDWIALDTNKMDYVQMDAVNFENSAGVRSNYVTRP